MQKGWIVWVVGDDVDESECGGGIGADAARELTVKTHGVARRPPGR